MKKNLIMGSGSGFSWNLFEPFITSFVKYSKNTELVLFVNNISNFTLDRLTHCGGDIKLEPFEHTNYIGIERFKNFKRYVDAHGDEYEQIFITDTRDVIFQGDIFEHFKNYSNFLGYATEVDDIAGSKTGNPFNYNLLVNSFGKEEADKLAKKKTVCAGSAIIGTPQEMKVFLEKLLSYNLQEYPFGFDQAAFNYLIYNNLIPIKNLIEIDVITGEIFTNGLITENKIRGDFILRGDGGIPSVVHQYDRHAPLVELVNRLYRNKNFQIDKRFTDTRSVIEQIPCLLHSSKVDEAAWLFMRKYIEGANLNENADLLLQIWANTLHQPLLPAVGYLELAVQNILISVKNFPGTQLDTICRFLTQEIKNRRVVYQPFVNYIARRLLNIAEQSLDANVPGQCFLCINIINSFELPLNKNFYLFVAKANRTFGRKDEAIAAYKKALELSEAL